MGGIAAHHVDVLVLRAVVSGLRVLREQEAGAATAASATFYKWKANGSTGSGGIRSMSASY